MDKSALQKKVAKEEQLILLLCDTAVKPWFLNPNPAFLILTK